ncbi:hypothetical protein M8818_003445 [Zalaria obscura]|uniref:Uncharacterized protein n=1 Tax=Zalaria obscura TaxID=2024903 RepID=A0ACC3SEQ9_9PEZI
MEVATMMPYRERDSYHLAHPQSNPAYYDPRLANPYPTVATHNLPSQYTSSPHHEARASNTSPVSTRSNSSDEHKPSLPSISNLLGIADGDRPSQQENTVRLRNRARRIPPPALAATATVLPLLAQQHGPGSPARDERPPRREADLAAYPAATAIHDLALRHPRLHVLAQRTINLVLLQHRSLLRGPAPTPTPLHAASPPLKLPPAAAHHHRTLPQRRDAAPARGQPVGTPPLHQRVIGDELPAEPGPLRVRDVQQGVLAPQQPQDPQPQPHGREAVQVPAPRLREGV